MIGLLANPVNHSYVCKTHEPGFDDTLYEGTKRLRVLEEFGLEQMILQYEQVSNSCTTSIHMQILDSENLMLARMRHSLMNHCGLTLRNFKECRVDSCLIQAGNKKADEVIKKIQTLTYDDVRKYDRDDGLHKYCPPKVVVEPRSNPSFTTAPQVFRADVLAGEKLEKTRLLGEYNLPVSNNDNLAPPFQNGRGTRPRRP